MVKIVEGEKVAFPLPGCTDIVVRLCSTFRRHELTYTIDAKEDNVIVARVEGDRIPLGTYALEVRGKIFGNDWRSNEYEQVAIVDRNADADTELGETDEGENSVEMDTAVVVLPPDRELEALVKEAQAQNKAMSELSDTIKVSEEGRAKSEELRAKSEAARVQAELTRASNEAERVQAEQARKESEERRGKSEELRAEAETARAIAESERTANEDGRASTENARAEAEKNRNAAEDTRTRTEIEREANELTRKSNEAKRQDNETARQDNEAKRKETEQKRENDTTSAISTMQAKTDEAVKTMQTKTDTATASMDEHRTAFDDAEATRVSNEQARVAAETARAEAESKRATQEQARRTAEEKREKAEELRVKNEESRQTNEQARITAETKRESDMAQAVDKANTASDIAISANEPFVWEPFKDLEHWNITAIAMDTTAGTVTVTLDTEEHGLAVGDKVVIAANVHDWERLYHYGRSWENCMSSSRMKKFPVVVNSSIPVFTVTAIDGAKIQSDKLSNYLKEAEIEPSEWQLQRAAAEYEKTALPDRYKGKPVTITVEGQYMSYNRSWATYDVTISLLGENGRRIYDAIDGETTAVPFVKHMCSLMAGHMEKVDIGFNLYGEKVPIGVVTDRYFAESKEGAWDIGQATTLYAPKEIGHYATRIIVTPYQELTKLGGGDDELKQMTALKRQWFAANAMLSREYWLPTYHFYRNSYEYPIPMRSGFYCKVKVLDHEATMCIAGGYVYSAAERARALNYLWVKDGHLAYNPTIGTKEIVTTDYVFDSDWHEVYVSWGDTWDRTWIDGALVMEHTDVTCRKNDTGKIYVFGYNALDKRTNVPDVGAAVIQGPVLLFWDGEVKAWHCGLSAKEDDDVERSTVMSCPTMHTFNGTIHDGQGGLPTADCTGLIHCEGTASRAWINIFGVWKEI